jgi:hypothetical protein
MKNFKNWLILMAAVLVFASCDGALGEDKKDTDQSGGVDFTSHTTDASIFVRNNTNQRLVAFKGELKATALVGGIPKGAQEHGLPNDPSLFSKTEGFPLILITEDQYNKNKNNLASLTNTPFTRIYVYYNKGGDNAIRYDISDKLGGTYKLVIQNRTKMNVELRINGVNGETIGYAPAGMVETTLGVREGDLDIFPVFKTYNPIRDSIDIVYPKGALGDPWSNSYNFSGNTTQLILNVTDILQNYTPATGVAWLVIDNHAKNAVQFVIGNTVQVNSLGYSYINAGEKQTFQINMPNVAGSNKFGDSVRIADYKVGAKGYAKEIQNTAGENEFVLMTDTVYTVFVTGDQNGTLLDNGGRFKGVVNMTNDPTLGSVPYTVNLLDDFEWK